MYAIFLMIVLGMLTDDTPPIWEQRGSDPKDIDDAFWDSTKGPGYLPRNTTTRDRVFEMPVDKPSRWKTGRP